MTTKQYEVLKWASLFLQENNREQRIAELLLQHHLGMTREKFIMNMREEIPPAVEKAFRSDIEKHARTGMPIQHMTGTEEFYGRRFKVNSDVLIPRPETEELVQRIIQTVKRNKVKNLRLVDVGTGSGIIAITLALELPGAEVIATDISEVALQVAKENASELEADVTFIQGNYLEPLIYQQSSVDILVSNPPYIAESEKSEMADTVKYFDPEIALFASDKGLAAFKKIVKQAPAILKKDGLLAFEIGYTQGYKVRQLIRDTFPQMNVEIIPDINGKDRIILAK